MTSARLAETVRHTLVRLAVPSYDVASILLGFELAYRTTSGPHLDLRHHRRGHLAQAAWGRNSDAEQSTRTY